MESIVGRASIVLFPIDQRSGHDMQHERYHVANTRYLNDIFLLLVRVHVVLVSDPR